MINNVGWIVVGIGIILIIIATIKNRRPEEAEISSSVMEQTSCKLGIVMILIGIIIKVITAIL